MHPTKINLWSLAGSYTEITDPGTTVQGQQEQRVSSWRRRMVRRTLSRRGGREMGIYIV